MLFPVSHSEMIKKLNSAVNDKVTARRKTAVKSFILHVSWRFEVVVGREAKVERSSKRNGGDNDRMQEDGCIEYVIPIENEIKIAMGRENTKDRARLFLQR